MMSSFLALTEAWHTSGATVADSGVTRVDLSMHSRHQRRAPGGTWRRYRRLARESKSPRFISMEVFGLSGWQLLSIGIGGLVFLFTMGMFLYSSMYYKAGPNEVLIISGRGQTHVKDGRAERLGFRLLQGGGTIVWPI